MNAKIRYCLFCWGSVMMLVTFIAMSVIFFTAYFTTGFATIAINFYGEKNIEAVMFLTAFIGVPIAFYDMILMRDIYRRSLRARQP